VPDRESLVQLPLESEEILKGGSLL
jgi:hypothetical protein